MNLLCWNGQWLPADTPLFTAQNRGFRYGDGLFETIKVYKGTVLLFSHHYERLQLGLKLLGIEAGEEVAAEPIEQLLLELCRKNHCLDATRVRWTVYRNENNKAGFVLEATSLPDAAFLFNEEGWTLGLYPFARKSCDALANLKTANYLPYILAGHYAHEKGVDECLVLNGENNLSDGSKTNLFLIHGRELLTPALHQGCVAGVMRRFVIEKAKEAGWAVKQTEITEAQLLEADEIFLTNAVQGIRWVRAYRNKTYTKEATAQIYRQVLAPLYQ